MLLGCQLIITVSWENVLWLCDNVLRVLKEVIIIDTALGVWMSFIRKFDIIFE